VSAISRYSLTKVRLLHLLEELKASSIETGTLCVPAGSSKTNIEAMMEAALNIKMVPEDLSKSLTESTTGGILFWGLHHWYLVMPPFPVAQESFSKTCEIEPLYGLLHQEFMLGLVLVRLGEYGIGAAS